MFRLIRSDGVTVGPEALEKGVAEGATPFWLEVSAPTSEEFNLLQNKFGLHPLAIEDCRHATKRPKLDDYGGYLFLVLFAVGDLKTGKLQAYNFFLVEKGVISISGSSLDLDGVCKRLQEKVVAFPTSPAHLFYLLASGLVDSFFPLLEGMDEQIDLLQDEIIARANPGLLRKLFAFKQILVRLRKVLSPQQDLFLSLSSPLHAYLREDALPYLRNLHDHVTRAYEEVDSYRDLLTGAMDVYLSTVSNRLSEVMKRLTIVATIFMPLSFITGFFGMNFAYLTGSIQQTAASFIVVVFLMVGTTMGMLWWFRRMKWL